MSAPDVLDSETISPEEQTLLALRRAVRSGKRPGQAVPKRRILTELRRLNSSVGEVTLDYHLGNLLSAGRIAVANRLWFVLVVALLLVGCGSSFSSGAAGSAGAAPVALEGGAAGSAGAAPVALEGGAAGSAGAAPVALEGGAAGSAGAAPVALEGGAAGSAGSPSCPACALGVCGDCTTLTHPSCSNPVFVYCF